MNEAVLNALMHLFAIVANVNGNNVSEIGRDIVESFLREHVSYNKIEKYLKLFDDYIAICHQNKIEAKSILKNDVELTNLCVELTSGLHKNNRVIIYLRLLEFVNEDNIVTPDENEILSIISLAFNIDKTEKKNCEAFILNKNIESLEKERLLIIEKKKTRQTIQTKPF